jgi:hypothetical protein
MGALREGSVRLTGRAAALLAAALISSPAVVQGAGAAAAAPAAAPLLADFTAGPSVCRALSPVSVTTDIYGGTDSAFKVDAGPLVHQRVPAAGFNPLLAPDAQLALYGFLPRPTDQARFATWTRRYQKFTGFAKPGLCVRDGLSNAVTDPAARSKDRTERVASGGVLLVAALGIALVWRRRSTSGGPRRRRMWLRPR